MGKTIFNAEAIVKISIVDKEPHWWYKWRPEKKSFWGNRKEGFYKTIFDTTYYSAEQLYKPWYKKGNATMSDNHQDHLCGLILSKALKAAGFDWEVNNNYNAAIDPPFELPSGAAYINWNKYQLTISRPTLYQAQRWMREVRGIDVFVLRRETANRRYYYIIGTTNYVLERSPTYHAALEAGLLEAVKGLEK